MDLLPNAEQEEIRSLVRGFLDNEAPVRRYRDASSRGAPYPAGLWRQFAELGWFGAGAPARVGGDELGLGVEILLAREGGRQLVSPAVLATAYSAAFAARHGEDQLAGELASGELRAALALSGEGEGGACLLFEHAAAEHILALGGGALRLFPRAAASDLEPLASTDESLALARARLAGAPPLSSAEPDDALRLAAPLCASLAGIAESACESAVAYAGERRQFGQPIGAFQAINHLCADMAVRNEAAWSQCVYASLCLEDGRADAARQVAAAAAVAPRAALENARANVQVHGGVGFTAEYDAHLLVKRAHVLSRLLASLLDSGQLLLAR